MAQAANIKLAEMQKVITETQGKTDTVSKWARRGVQSEAHSNISYLKRRINDMGNETPIPEEEMATAEKYLSRLQQIIKD